MNALATCAASAWYLTLNMMVILVATFIEPLAKWEHGRLSLARTIHNSTASVGPCAAGFPLLRGRPPFGSTIISVLHSSWMCHRHPGVSLTNRSHRRSRWSWRQTKDCISTVTYLLMLPIFHYQGSPRSGNPSINKDIWRRFFKSPGKVFLKSF